MKVKNGLKMFGRHEREGTNNIHHARENVSHTCKTKRVHAFILQAAQNTLLLIISMCVKYL